MIQMWNENLCKQSQSVLFIVRVIRQYEFNHYKSGIVAFGGTNLQHFESLKNCEWFLGDTKVEELYEYKNLGVLKNYVGSYSSNIDDNIDKTRKKLV